MDKEEKFKVLTDDGKEIECDILLTFDLEETNKHYVVYTDNTMDNEGNTNVYALLVNSPFSANLAPLTIINSKIFLVVATPPWQDISTISSNV